MCSRQVGYRRIEVRRQDSLGEAKILNQAWNWWQGPPGNPLSHYPGRPHHETEGSCASERPSSGDGADEAFPNGIELGTILSLSNPIHR